jgi:hypothetical protein
MADIIITFPSKDEPGKQLLKKVMLFENGV